MKRTVSILTQSYYEVVDRQYASYCVLDSYIIQSTLKRFGIQSRVVPCQLAYDSGQRSILIGFTGMAQPGQWDGHVAVKIKDVLIDCGTGSLNKYFGVKVPSAVAASCLSIPSTRIAWLAMNDTDRLIWIEPPSGCKPTPPKPPMDLVAEYSDKLSVHIKRHFDGLKIITAH